MITSAEFCDVLLKHHYSFVTGVPCSYLTPLINYSMTNRSFEYVNAANEGDAVAIAAGASLGGYSSVAMFQNSGLGNAVSPLTSLTWVFRIPVLLIVTWRGQPGGPKDEPQHELMGKITTEQLRLMDIPFWQVPRTANAFGSMMSEVSATSNLSQRPVALLLEKDSIAPQVGKVGWNRASTANLKANQPFEHSQPSSIAFDPDEVIRCIANSLLPTDFVIATTGYTGRSLFNCGDRASNIYMVGSMGCVSSFAMGLALAQPSKRFIAIDGDGSFLMRMGALAAIGHQQPPNLLHIVLDNGVHESTGGQPSLSSNVDFSAIAAASGYPSVQGISDLEELRLILHSQKRRLGLLCVKTKNRNNVDLPRPTCSPESVAKRFRRELGLNPE